MPNDRPIDGVDQTDLLLGTSDAGQRDTLLTFVGPDLMAGAGSSSARISPTSRRAAADGAARTYWRGPAVVRRR